MSVGDRPNENKMVAVLYRFGFWLLFVFATPSVSREIIDTCPDGSQPVNCFADPCSVPNCPQYSTARCEADYCPGCSARYYIGDQEVTEQCNDASNEIERCSRQGGRDLAISCALGTSGYCPADSYCDVHPTDAFAVCCCNNSAATCPNCTQPVSCFSNPCTTSSCSNIGNAVCKADYCGGCNARYYVGDREVTGQCSNTGSTIQPCARQGGNNLQVNCGRGTSGQCPMGAYCDIHPTDSFATCCCNDTAATCPGCTRLVNCLVEPCSTANPCSVAHAECRNDYCGGCNAKFFVGNTEVTDQCSLAIQCTEGQPPCGSYAYRPIANWLLLLAVAILFVIVHV